MIRRGGRNKDGWGLLSNRQPLGILPTESDEVLPSLMQDAEELGDRG